MFADRSSSILRSLLPCLLLLGVVFRAAPGHRPLDLPAGGRGPKEDAREALERITFYGAEFEGEGFFWCLDASGSMETNGRLEILKREVARALRSLSRHAELGLVAFNQEVFRFRARPESATPGVKTAAEEWLFALVAEGSTCLTAAALATLEISSWSRKKHRSVFVVGDGLPFCDGEDTSELCLAEVTRRNVARTPIHTIYVASDEGGVEFMTELAYRNGGRFRQVE